MTARILVVDDVEPNVRLLEAKLTLEYYEVLTACDGATALRIASDERPDIILLDVMMPGMDGFETCRRLKADPVTRHIPVVLVTALDGREDKLKGLAAGADDFVTKPIDDVVLFARVKSLVRLKSVMDELREREETGRRIGVDTDGAGRLRGSGGRVLVTALDGREDKLKGLEAGADDFVTKPIDDVVLFARVKSLVRLKSVMDELREREETGRRIGVDTDGAGRLRGSGGRVLIVDDNVRQAEKMVEHLAGEHRPTVEADPAAALIAARGPVDLMIVNVSSSEFDGLRFVAQVRSTEASRRLPILAVVDQADRPRLLKALELGVNDILPRPVDPEELEARTRTQIKRKRYADFLKQKLDYSLEMAVTDALTGLHNRRYMAGQLQGLMNRAGQGGEGVAVLVMDIDHFKLVNDGFGHDAGDEVLREFAVRLATNVRAIDLPCRLGGEEFVVVMPGASMEDAVRVADRIRRDVASQPFPIMNGAEGLTITVSVGVASSDGINDTPEALLKRADEGVYEAKAHGRNQVIARAA